MTQRQLKAGYFALTWLNIYAVAYYFNYLFFHLKQDFGFSNRENLYLAALNGLIYVPGSWLGGRFAQRAGYFAALKIGVGTMGMLLAIGTFVSGVVPQILIFAGWTLGMCFTWAPLEALASHNESRRGLADMVGIYNVVWASGAAVAFFLGGATQSVLGKASLYWLPALLHAIQFGLLLWLERQANRSRHVNAHEQGPSAGEVEHHDYASAAQAKAFLRMAWWANPFSYMAMNTVVPLIPDVAARLNLSTTLAGFVASVWMFGRLFAFIVLWRWTKWHYRFGWLLAAYLVLVVSFFALLTAPSVLVLVAAQIVFGLAVGLIYYSSLFYAMDVGGETQGEHGGVHEALIGVGIFAGPAVGAAAVQFAPNVANGGIGAVGAVILIGLAGLFKLRS